MSIMSRFVKLCRADIHGIMDQMEDKGLLLKQYIRDMEESVRESRCQLEDLQNSSEGAESEYEKRTNELEKLDREVTEALKKERDDIARMLIKRSKRVQNHQSEISHHISSLEAEVEKLQEAIIFQEHQLEKVKIQATSYFHRQSLRKENQSGGGFHSPMSSDPSNEEVELELLRRKEALEGGAV